MSDTDRVKTEDVIAWHRARFGEPDTALVALKLAEETGEVAEAVVKRAEGAVRPAKGLTTREEWTAHLLGEIGDVGIVLHTLCAREGTTLDEVIAARFRGDVSKRERQESSPW
jgi:NTP pyrophosphatase (non-canonical NTP hydrolase)